MLRTQFLLSLFFFALAIIFCKVAVLAKTFRIVKLIRMLACPSFLRPSNAVIAAHAHLLGVVATRVMGTAEDLVFEIALISFKT